MGSCALLSPLSHVLALVLSVYLPIPPLSVIRQILCGGCIVFYSTNTLECPSPCPVAVAVVLSLAEMISELVMGIVRSDSGLWFEGGCLLDG